MAKIVFKKNEPDIAWRLVDKETAIIPLEQNISNKIIILNQTATRIWEMINGKNSNEDITRKILQEYDVNPKDAKGQVEKIIAYLSRKNVIKKC